MGLFSKDIATMDDLFVHTLRDVYYAEKKITKSLPEMIDQANDPQLKQAFSSHLKETENHVARVDEVFRMHGVEAKAVDCPAIDGIIEEAEDVSGEVDNKNVLDAALIAAAQRIEHWEMATYGTARSYAEALGDYDAVRILQQTLDEEGHADHVLTKLAERGINQAAGDDLLEESTRYRSRLRFVGAKDFPEVREHDIHLHNRAGEHLGTLDGFIVDSQSGRPIYYVIDSRGWFAGRRYVVPVGQIDAEESADALRTSLTRAELARYPEFSPSAFTAMDDHDALRYERRLHRVFAPDTKPYDGRPVYENLPVYQTPTWLMTGVWMSDSSGFAVTPPRADSDATTSVRPVELPTADTGAYERTAEPEGELMMARGEPEPPRPGTEEPPQAAEPHEPRIERYRER